MKNQICNNELLLDSSTNFGCYREGRNMRNTIIMVIILILSGCALGPQTKEELYGDYGYLEKRCSETDYDIMYELLVNNMRKCIAKETSHTTMAGNMIINSSSRVTIQNEYTPEKASIAAYVAGGPGHYFYTTVVDLTKTDKCNSNLIIHGMSSMNKNDLELIDWWLAGNDDCEP